MIRVVSFPKAIIAGIAGSVAWEAVVRTAIIAGVPLHDMVHHLGTLVAVAPAGAWWVPGMLMHTAVGVAFAIFYAYFVWTELPLPPVAQGMLFSLVPLAVAGLVVDPQLSLMHPHHSSTPGTARMFALDDGWGGPVGLGTGHVVFGVVLGLCYRRPVGSRVGSRRRVTPSMPRPSVFTEDPSMSPPISKFLFATGIESSYPTIDGGRWRFDQMEATFHYRHWRRDLELVRSLGLRYLRYGPPWYRLHLGPERYDWSFMDEVGGALQELGITPIVDLCHFGAPDWLSDFQNQDLPAHFSEYCRAFATRYPWVRLYTPVNEMYVTARMSALLGAWNEQRSDERSYVTATVNLAKASALGMQAISKARADAIFITSESSECFLAASPRDEILKQADFENQRRFIALDLLYAHQVRGDIYAYLMDNGMDPSAYEWFMNQRAARRGIIGIDYYSWNEKLVTVEGRSESLGEVLGWYLLAREYYDRYRRPLMHTETNCLDARAAPTWLWRQWHNVRRLRMSGVPVVGFTWYSLHDQVDWQIGMRKAEGNVNPVGLFDLNRDPRPVARAYRDLIAAHADESLFPFGDLFTLA